MVSGSEASQTRSSKRGWTFGFVVGAVAGLVLGLAIGPTGASLIGFQLPYLKLSLGDAAAPTASASDPSPNPGPQPLSQALAAKPAAAAVQPASFVKPKPLQVPAGHVLTIGVFGDSMADGLWAALYRDLRKTGQVEVLRMSRNSTGLARYDYVDIQAQTQEQLAQHHVDIAVVMFGTNDGQGMINHGKVFGFATPEWRQVYTGRIDALVNLLRGQGATVYWVGLPRMEKDYFDKRSQLLNGIYQERAAALSMPFIPTVPASVDEQGRYDAYLAAPGEAHKRLMRASDGIHMTMAGYLRIAAPVSSRIREDLAAATQAPHGATETAARP